MASLRSTSLLGLLLALLTLSSASSPPPSSSPLTSDLLSLPKSLGLESYLPGLSHDSDSSDSSDSSSARKLWGGSLFGGDDYGTTGEDVVIKRRLYNTSIVLTVPMFSWVLPTRVTPGTGASIDLANQAIFGLFSLLVTVIIFTIPIIFTGTTHARSLETSSSWSSMLDSHKNKVLNLMGADLTNQIGLNRESCLQKTICEAHRSPERYGLFGLPFRIFFPPPVEGTSRASASIYQLAAADGLAKKNDTTVKDCKKAYRCFFDVLDLANYCLDVLTYANGIDHVGSSLV